MKLNQFINEYKSLNDRKRYLQDTLKEIELSSSSFRYDNREKVQTSNGNTIERMITSRISKKRNLEDEIISIDIDLIRYECVIDILDNTEKLIFSMLSTGYTKADVSRSLGCSVTKVNNLISTLENEKLIYCDGYL